MDPNDDDLQMLDVPPSSSKRSLISPAGQDSRSITSPAVNNMLSTGINRPIIPNGFQDAHGYSTSVSDNEVQIASSKHSKSPLRGSPNLAKDFPTHLSIENAIEGLQEDTDSFFDGLGEEEHELVTPYTSILPTGYCYDVRMRYHCELEPPEERKEFHPEDPRRIWKIYQELCYAGLIKNEKLNSGYVIPNPLVNVPAREVTEAEVTLVHDKKHFDFIRSTSKMDPRVLPEKERDFDSIYLNTTTFACALLSAGGAIETCREVVAERMKNAIAIIRPPGHHAESSRPMGFCIFDNVSIATKVCQKDFPDTCRKVLILDWDVHHGNGIQQAFYRDPNVLYISLHVHEGGNFYPSGPYGDHFHCGAREGLGMNINIPWPTKGMGDADYMFAFQHVVMPVAHEFDPDLVIIAAGFDAAAGDQLGGCFVSPACYAHMTHMLKSLAHGKLVVCLEGGYNLRSISKSALAVTRALVGEIPGRMEDRKATAAGIETVQQVAMYQSRFWPCLFPKNVAQGQWISSPTHVLNEAGAERMHDVIRYYQASQLKENYSMINLTIYRNQLSKSFDNQVMATPNFEQALPLVVILHDPPEMMGIPQPLTKGLEPHNTWLADGLKHYVDWAVKEGFAVIDANVPKHLSGVDEEDGYSEENRKSRIRAVEELAVYLWDNYINCNDATKIVFVGVGSSNQGIMHLLTTRTEDFIDSVVGMINFIDGPADHISKASDQFVYDRPKWYRANSLNLVSASHLIWSLDRKKSSSKRMGNLLQSPQSGLNNMLVEHQEDVQDFILEKLGLVDRSA